MAYDLGPKFAEDVDFDRENFLYTESDELLSSPDQRIIDNESDENTKSESAVEDESLRSTIDILASNYGGYEGEWNQHPAPPGSTALIFNKETGTISENGVPLSEMFKDFPDAVAMNAQIEKHFAENPNEPHIRDWKGTNESGGEVLWVDVTRLKNGIVEHEMLSIDLDTKKEQASDFDFMPTSLERSEDLASVDSVDSISDPFIIQIEEESKTTEEVIFVEQADSSEIQQELAEVVVPIEAVVEIVPEVITEVSGEVVHAQEFFVAIQEESRENEELIGAETITTDVVGVADTKDAKLTQILTEIFSEPLPIVGKFTVEQPVVTVTSKIDVAEAVRIESVLSEERAKPIEEKIQEEALKVIVPESKQEVIVDNKQKVEIVNAIQEIQVKETEPAKEEPQEKEILGISVVQEEFKNVEAVVKPVAANENREVVLEEKISVQNVLQVEQSLLQEEHMVIDRIRTIEEIRTENMPAERDVSAASRFAVRAEGVRRAAVSSLSAANDEDGSETVFQTSRGSSLNGITMQRAA